MTKQLNEFTDGERNIFRALMDLYPAADKWTQERFIKEIEAGAWDLRPEITNKTGAAEIYSGEKLDDASAAAFIDGMTEEGRAGVTRYGFVYLY